MVSESKYIKIVKASAIYDLVVTIGFATPWTFAFIYSVLSSIDASLGIPGEFPLLDHAHILFATLLGSVVTVWSAVRVLQPTVMLGRGDAVARILFVTWQIYAVASGASMLILCFTFMELVFFFAQIVPVKKDTQTDNQAAYA